MLSQSARIILVLLLILACSMQVYAADFQSTPKMESELKAEDTFPDYQPKKSIDGVLDYRPGLLSRINKLPVINSKTFSQAITELGRQKYNATDQPGTWVKGNLAQGAQPKEYMPSDAELLASELGKRLAEYVNSADILELIKAWDGAALLPPFPIEYNRFEYRHVDVMGSGRCYYVSKPIKTLIDKRKKRLNK